MSEQNGKSLKDLLLTLMAPSALRPTVKEYDADWYDVPGVSVAFNLGSRPAHCVELAGRRTNPNANAETVFEVQFGRRGPSASPSSSSSSMNETQGDAHSNNQIQKDTLFQAASMSKVFLSFGICRLIDTGYIRSVFDPITDYLDKDTVVNEMALNLVRNGTMPDHDSACALLRSIRISDLMAHTSSVNVDTFLGYTDGCLSRDGFDAGKGHRQSAALPCATTVVLGQKHRASDQERALDARSPPILPQGLPGLTTKYSGGGCMILQLIVERCINMGFESWMQLLLEKLDMSDSFYGRPPDDASIAKAHSNADVIIPGGYAVYAEQGAIGLWSTPSDLVRGLSSIARILQQGDDGSSTTTSPSLVRQSTLHQVLLLDHDGEDQAGSYSMGFRIHTFRRAKRFADRSQVMISHRGRSLGYQSWAGVVVDLEDKTVPPVALAIMTNSEEGDYLRDALLSALSAWLHQPFDAACRFKPVVPFAEIDEMREGGDRCVGQCQEAMVGKYIVQHQHVPTAIWTRSFVIEEADTHTHSGVWMTVQFPETLGEMRIPLHCASHRGYDKNETLYRVGGLRTAICVRESDEIREKPTVSLMQDGKILKCERSIAQ